MSIFESESKSPTKMFINRPEETVKTKSISKSGGLTNMIPGGFVIELIGNAAPKLIEKGLEVLSSTINKFADTDVTKTSLKRNIDILNETEVSIPRNITIIRGDFAAKVIKNLKDKETAFGDEDNHQATLMGHEELRIEIDIRQSDDKKSICFQPTKYFYNGVDREKDTIDEIVLAIAFVPVSDSIINVEKLTFKSFIHFENLTAHTQYEFGSRVDGYDANHASSWMQPNIDPKVPYTLVIEIQEIREGNSFAKLLQTVYDENKSYIKDELEAKVKLLEEWNKMKEAES